MSKRAPSAETCRSPGQPPSTRPARGDGQRVDGDAQDEGHGGRRARDHRTDGHRGPAHRPAGRAVRRRGQAAAERRGAGRRHQRAGRFAGAGQGRRADYRADRGASPVNRTRIGGIQRPTGWRRPAFTRGGGRQRCQLARVRSGSSLPARADPRRRTWPSPAADEVRVRTLFTGISRGTEALVFRGGVPEGQREVMRAPYQEGDFPGPVKYGYLNVGVVESGPPDLVGRTVFCLYPHQTRYVVPAAAVTVVPTGCPPRRAVLAGTVETAVNALWDARSARRATGSPSSGAAWSAPASRGCSLGSPADGDPGRPEPGAGRAGDRARVSVTPQPEDAPVSSTWSGTPARRPPACSWPSTCWRRRGRWSTSAGTATRPVTLALGEAFHDRRLTIRSSQVGVVAPARRRSRTTGDRLRAGPGSLAGQRF